MGKQTAIPLSVTDKPRLATAVAPAILKHGKSAIETNARTDRKILDQECQFGQHGRAINAPVFGTAGVRVRVKSHRLTPGLLSAEPMHKRRCFSFLTDGQGGLGGIQFHGVEVALHANYVLQPDSHRARWRFVPDLQTEHRQGPIGDWLRAA